MACLSGNDGSGRETDGAWMPVQEAVRSRGDGTTVWASCRSRFASVCLSCERSYQIDTKKIRRDGFDSLRFDHMLVTFMFDSFGRVHSMAKAGHKGHGASRSGARAAKVHNPVKDAWIASLAGAGALRL